MNIVERQTVVIYVDLAGPIQEFSYNLDLEFIPDHMVVRDVSYSAGGALGQHGIIANFCRAKNNVIAHFNDSDPTPYHSNPESTYRIEHSSSTLGNGEITFRVRRLGVNGGLLASVATGDLAITLEFHRTIPERNPEDIILQSIDAILAKHIIKEEKTYPFQLPNQSGGNDSEINKSQQQFMDPSSEVIPDVQPKLERQEAVDLQPEIEQIK